jgi:predicted aspartyl protease
MITNIIFAVLLAQLTFSLMRDSLVVVPVTLNGAGPYKFLLDTGATNTIVSSRVADHLKIQAFRHATLLTAGGELPITVRIVKTVKIGSVEITDMQIAVAEADVFRKLEVDGIIGADCLKQFKISIDYTRRMLTMQP